MHREMREINATNKCKSQTKLFQYEEDELQTPVETASLLSFFKEGKILTAFMHKYSHIL